VPFVVVRALQHAARRANSGPISRVANHDLPFWVGVPPSHPRMRSRRSLSLSDALVIPSVERFLRRHSDVAVKVIVTDRHLDLAQDELDVSLRVGPQPASSLVFRRLLWCRHIQVAAPAYLAGADALEKPADLTRHRLLGFTKWFDETTWTLSNGSRTERVPAKPGWASTTTRA
jgi:DNA-binding transcriptional LysR family regulator